MKILSSFLIVFIIIFLPPPKGKETIKCYSIWQNYQERVVFMLQDLGCFFNNIKNNFNIRINNLKLNFNWIVDNLIEINKNKEKLQKIKPTTLENINPDLLNDLHININDIYKKVDMNELQDLYKEIWIDN